MPSFKKLTPNLLVANVGLLVHRLVFKQILFSIAELVAEQLRHRFVQFGPRPIPHVGRRIARQRGAQVLHGPGGVALVEPQRATLRQARRIARIARDALVNLLQFNLQLDRKSVV